MDASRDGIYGDDIVFVCSYCNWKVCFDITTLKDTEPLKVCQVVLLSHIVDGKYENDLRNLILMDAKKVISFPGNLLPIHDGHPIVAESLVEIVVAPYYVPDGNGEALEY